MESGRTEWTATAYSDTAQLNRSMEIPDTVIYCERCFALGKCPPDAKREQTTIDNPNINVFCGDCLEEIGCTPIDHQFSFGVAIDALRNGLKVTRKGWNGKGLWLELQIPDENSKMTLPYIYINYPSDAVNTPGARVPWLASQTDMLTDDWMVVSNG